MSDKIKCPICEKLFRKNLIKRHLKVTEGEDDSVYFELLYTKNKISHLINDYINLKLNRNSLSSKYEISYNHITDILNFYEIEIRSHSEEKKNNDYIEKYNQTVMEKYNVDNISKLEWVKEKKKKTTFLNHGVDNIIKLKKVRDKCIENSKSEKSIEKRMKSLKETLNNYGVDNITQLDWVKEKISKTQKARFDKMTYDEKLKLTEKARSHVKYESKLETRIENLLKLFNIKYLKHVFLYRYNFDFLLYDKFIIEVQGDYWHANPKFYKKSDILLGELSADDIWRKDEKKKKVVEKNGYEILYLWEDFINKSSDEEIINLILEKYE